jgi:hypothetical protein
MASRSDPVMVMVGSWGVPVKVTPVTVAGDEAGTWKAAIPAGVPSPVGPSYPLPAVHRYAGAHVPVAPEVTSWSADFLAA